MNQSSRDTALLAFGITSAFLQQAAYAVWGVTPNVLLLGISVGCMLGGTVLSKFLDYILSLLPGYKNGRKNGE